MLKKLLDQFNYKKAYDSLRTSHEALMSVYQATLAENVKLQNKKFDYPFKEIFEMQSIHKPVEKIPNTRDNASFAKTIIGDDFFNKIVNQVILERTQMALECSADNKQFSLIVTSILGIKALVQEFEKYSSYIEDEEFNEFDKYSIT